MYMKLVDRSCETFERKDSICSTTKQDDTIATCMRKNKLNVYGENFNMYLLRKLDDKSQIVWPA